MKSLLGRFLTIESILSSDNVENVDFMNPNNHLHKDDVSVGMNVWKMEILLQKV